MTIFRRRSKTTANEAPILEASPSTSTYWRGDLEDKENALASSEFRGELVEDVSSTSTCYSNMSGGMDDSEAELVQAFSEFSVKLDEKDDVFVSMEVPSSVPVDDLTVQVDDGILRVSGDVSNDEEDAHTVEQAFQLDEQSLDINKVTANLSDGVLTITAPKKDKEDVTLVEALPIETKKPPQMPPTAFQVIVDVPGVHLEDIFLSYGNGKLRIAANRHFGRSRSFKRTLLIDTQKFDPDFLQTYLYEGRLVVMVPPKEESVLRTIKIQTDCQQGAKKTAKAA